MVHAGSNGGGGHGARCGKKDHDGIQQYHVTQEGSGASLCASKVHKDAHVGVKIVLTGHPCTSYRHITTCKVLWWRQPMTLCITQMVLEPLQKGIALVV